MKTASPTSLAQQFLNAYGHGAFAFLHALQIEPLEIGNGTGKLRLVLQPMHLRVGGIMHGGVATALLDTVLGLAAATRAPKQHDVVTAELNINFIKSARAGEVLFAEAVVLHSGRRTCVGRGDIRNGRGELVAAGSGTLMFVPMPLEDAEQLLALSRGEVPPA